MSIFKEHIFKYVSNGHLNYTTVPFSGAVSTAFALDQLKFYCLMLSYFYCHDHRITECQFPQEVMPETQRCARG